MIEYPGEVTIVAALVEDPMPAGTAGGHRRSGQARSMPGSAARGPWEHDEYVWHCHILEHEEHDMMRPLVASLRSRKPAPTRGRRVRQMPRALLPGLLFCFGLCRRCR